MIALELIRMSVDDVKQLREERRQNRPDPTGTAMNYESVDALVSSVDWKATLDRPCVYVEGGILDMTNTTVLQGIKLHGRYDYKHSANQGQSVGFKVITSHQKGAPNGNKMMPYKKDDEDAKADALNKAKHHLISYNIDHYFFLDMCAVLDESTLVRFKKTYHKNDYDITIESSHVFSKVPTIDFMGASPSGPTVPKINLPDDFLSTYDIVAVSDVDMSVRDKLQAFACSSNMIGSLKTHFNDGVLKSYEVSHEKFKNKTFSFDTEELRIQQWWNAMNYMKEMNVLNRLFTNYIYVVDDDTVVVTINSKSYGVKRVFIDAKYASLIKPYKIHMVGGQYAGLRIKGKECYLHHYIYHQEHPEFVPCKTIGLIDHKNQYTLDCRMTNLRDVTSGGNNRNLSRREGTKLYTNPVSGIRFQKGTLKKNPKWEMVDKVDNEGKPYTRSFEEGREDLRRLHLRDMVRLHVTFMKQHRMTNGMVDIGITCDNIDDYSVNQITARFMELYDDAAKETLQKEPR